jgi:hypothetical protein
MLRARLSIVGYRALIGLKKRDAYVFLHNMIIESHRKNPAMDDQPYDGQCRLAETDYQVLADFAAFLAMHTEIRGIDTH